MSTKRPKYLVLGYPFLSKELRDKLEQYELDMHTVYLFLYRLINDESYCDEYYDIFENKAKEFGLMPGTPDYRDVLFVGRDLFREVVNGMHPPLQAHIDRVTYIKDVTLDKLSILLTLSDDETDDSMLP